MSSQLVVWNIFNFSIYWKIPTDYHIFQRFRGVGIPLTRSSLLVKLAFLENSDVTGDTFETHAIYTRFPADLGFMDINGC